MIKISFNRFVKQAAFALVALSSLASTAFAPTAFALTKPHPASASGEQAFDPMGGLLNKAASIPATLEVASEADLEKLKKNPKYHNYFNGGWDFLEKDKGAPLGEYCFAFYTKGDGFVRVSGPGGSYKGALLTFWGKDVPQTEKIEKIKVTFKQTGEPTQTLLAFNSKQPTEMYGAITFAVPTIEAAMEGMLDQQSFEIIYEGKTIAKVEWRDGLRAKQRLGECVKAKKSRSSH